MKKAAVTLLLTLFCAAASFAQSTTVSGTVTDQGSQAWAGGTYTFIFTPNPQYPTEPYSWTGGTLNSVISGSLDSSGHYSVSIPSSSAITPASSTWVLRVTPNATSQGFSTPATIIAGSTQTLNVAPPAILISWSNPPGAATSAYSDAEITGTLPVGAEYFNVTSGLTRVWNGSTWANQGGGSGGGVGGAGTAPDQTCWSATAAIGNCAVQITGTPVAGYIPIATNATTAPWMFPSFAKLFNVQAYGAVGDGSHLSADTTGITNALNACSAVGGLAWVPHGTYQFDNSTAPLVFASFNCTIAGEGKASSIAFNTLANDGFDFNSATNLNIQGIAWSFSPTATTRGGGYPINIDQIASTGRAIIQNNYFNNGNRSGIRIGNTNNVLFAGNVITNFLANGAFTINNQHLKMANNHYENNQDAAEEFSFYDSGTQASCQDIISTGMSSTNDLSGFLIDSCKNVSLSNANIVGAAHEAIVIQQDPATTTVQFPDQIQIANVSATDTGYGTNPLNRNTAQCIYISVAGAPATFQNILLTNINCKHTAGRGLELGDSGTVNLTWSNLRIDDAGNGNTSATAECIFTDGNVVKGTNTFASNCGTYALRNHLTTYGDYTAFFSVNPNQLGAAANGFLNESNGGLFVMKDVTRNDTWTGASRSGISSTASSGVQAITGLTDICFPIACAQPVFGNSSPILSVGGSVTVPVLVGNLGSASGNKGAYRTVSDSTAISAEGQTCVGGSSNTALAFSNGTVWKCF